MPKVSVLMPVYNAENYIEEAIDSILEQTFVDFEFLIFNDASTDKSLDIINKYDDSRIRLFDSPDNKGYVYHLNEGIKQATGEFIARMDNDDISLPTRFEKQVEFLEQNPNVGMCGTWYAHEGGTYHGHLTKLPTNLEDINLLLLYANAFSHPSVMLRKQVLWDHNLQYKVQLMPSEDYALWVTLLDYCDLANIPEVLFKYRIHDNNASKKKKTELQIRNRAKYQLQHIKRVFQYADINNDEFILLQKFFSQTLEKNRKNIKQILQVLKKIKYCNKFDRVSQEQMKNFLNQKFFYLCTTSTHLGFWILGKYLKNDLKISSFKLNFYFLLKSLFFIKQT